jgi:hypothetical protein
MIPWLRSVHRIGLWNAARALGCGAVAVAITAIMIMMRPGDEGHVGLWLFGGALVMTLASLFLVLTRVSLADSYDPNAEDPEARKEYAHGRAFLKKDLIVEKEKPSARRSKKSKPWRSATKRIVAPDAARWLR